jgi:hypothetical protein
MIASVLDVILVPVRVLMRPSSCPEFAEQVQTIVMRSPMKVIVYTTPT